MSDAHGVHRRRLRRRIGTVLMAAGLIMVLGAGALALSNSLESRHAAESSSEIVGSVEALVEGMPDGWVPDPYETDMPAVDVGGYECIGYLTIPSLDLKLPVLSGWDYDRLKAAPCRYFGSTITDDLVIAGHNYESHFGSIGTLAKGAKVFLTDMNGIANSYRVTQVEVRDPYDIQGMTGSDYDLTLFTCTYGGASRVTVRCDRV